MGRLYSQASVVRAWLGPERDAKLVFNYMRHAGNTFLRPNKELVLEVMRDKLDPVYLTLREFFSRPYFYRRWIIQEVALASDVICQSGSLELSWDALSQATSNVRVDDILREGQGMPLAFSDMEHVLTTIEKLRSKKNSQLRNPVEGMVLKFQIKRLDDTSTDSTPAILDLFSIACVTRSFSVIKDPDHQDHLNTPVQLIDYIDTVILLRPTSSTKDSQNKPNNDDDNNNNGVFQSIKSFQTVYSFLRKEAYHTDQVCRSCRIFRIPVRQRIRNIDVVNLLSAHLYRIHAEFRGSKVKEDQPRQTLTYLQNPWSESEALHPRQKLIARFLRGRCMFVSRGGHAGVANLRVRPGDRLVSVTRGEPDFVLRFKK
ncbi:hypothetical protein M7I_7548 [Glarea lozoyensis 74030]|uniref:Heterokaryon incompatibility domain-containing protein n=1 Tax=Glarea lozoyensis (strain ATCC 74030 / MF5533) TaxID=1104152 RepID=H0EXL1_GLAL7|nr:hypothetical protein M7I_7548 [Glarea lozoyensis 74030]